VARRTTKATQGIEAFGRQKNPLCMTITALDGLVTEGWFTRMHTGSLLPSSCNLGY
jgi:hypothetical protein